MARKIFRRDIYSSYPTIKVEQYYYFYAWRLAFWGRRDMICLSSALNFSRDSVSPAPYKQLCQIMK